MTAKNNQPYLTKMQLQGELAPLITRIDRLWDEVFPKGPPGPVTERLEQVSHQLADLDQRITKETASRLEQIKKVLEITAELKEIVEDLKNRGLRVMTAGS